MNEADQFFASLPDAGLLTITPLTGTIYLGMSVFYAGDTNRIRRRVVGNVSASQFIIKKFVRPSRGFARHIRKQKRMGR